MRDGRSRVYRRVGERCADACVIQHRCFSGCSVMVWGGVKERGRTLLVVDAGYLTGRRYVIPFIQAQANNVKFQQDNARPHIARVIRDYLIRCATLASGFIRSFTQLITSGMKWNDGYVICTISQ